MAHVMDPQPPAAADAQLHEWLALTPEEPLEPQLEIVDPHHHLCAHHPKGRTPTAKRGPRRRRLTVTTPS